METFLPLVSAAFIPFIPNDVLRYAALAMAIFCFIGRLIYSVSPACLEASIKNIEEQVDAVNKECVKNPCFVYEAALKVVEIKYTVSNLRTKTIDAKDIAWKKYPQHVRNLALSVAKCRREMEQLESSLHLELELARQQKYQQDINHRKATLHQTFPAEALAAGGSRALRMRSDWAVIEAPSGDLEA